MSKTEEQVVETVATENVEVAEVSETKTEKKSRSAKNTKKSAQRPSRKEKDNRFEERVVAINRISKLAGKQATWRLETDEECPNPMFKLVVCSECNKAANNTYKFCPNCGCVMTGLTTEGVNFG